MAQVSTAQKLHETETEVAVLQVQYNNLNEKVDEVKTSLNNLHEHINTKIDGVTKTIKEFKEANDKQIADFKTANDKQHSDVSKRIGELEKWRWLITGGAAAAGALGFHVVGKIFGFS